jgi:hypothetical protein
VPGRRSSRTPLLPGKGPLSGVPPAVAFLVVLGLFVAGVLLKGLAGAALLGVLVLFVLGLLVATWSALTPGLRVMRVVILLILLVVAVAQLR